MSSFRCALCHATDIPRSRVKRALCEDCPPRLAARGLAWCARGKHRVAASAMARHSCRACESKRNAERYQEHRTERLAKAKARYWQNPEAARKQDKAYRARHGATINARRRLRYATDPAYRTQRREQVRQATDHARARECTAAWRRAHPGANAAMSRIWRQRQKLRIWGIR